MYKEVSKLLLYSNLGGDSILENLARIFEDWEKGSQDKSALTGRIYKEIKRILDISTIYGFNTNLWHN